MTPIIRPLGGSRWGFDFFHWNFTFGFTYNIAIQCAADVQSLARVAALPLVLLMLQISMQLLLTQMLALNTNLVYLCRVSSMPKGAGPIRPPVYTIIEDVVAVDGMQGTVWRASFNEWFEKSERLRLTLSSVTWAWGLTGLAVGAVDLTLIFVVGDVDAAWILGKSLHELGERTFSD